ncbi:MAG: hypothetical protein SWK76_07515 [Actinomycetota bacterium]|nr:hypothetical protein [Actinomycetota bacterium]
MESTGLGGMELSGWRLGDKVLIPTPGHSSCSVTLVWPARKAVLVSDADWTGNPVLMDSSLRDCRSSLETKRSVVEAGIVDLFLPAHGEVKEGGDQILSHLDFHIQRLKLMREEILSFSTAAARGISSN